MLLLDTVLIVYSCGVQFMNPNGKGYRYPNRTHTCNTLLVVKVLLDFNQFVIDNNYVCMYMYTYM